jgi:cell wall-associated NlpC family hydrolase
MLTACTGVVCLSGFIGCGSSSPRFNTARHEDAGADRSDAAKSEYRFAAKIKAEEAREDDRKVDVDKVRKDIRNRPVPTGRYSNRTPEGINRDRVLLNVVSYLGVPYLYGGNSKAGIDCSGFTLQVYENAALRKLPRSVEEQYQTGIEVEKDSLQFGDLLFFNTTGESPYHVGIYIEDDLFAHSSVSAGVTFSSLESTYFRRRFVGARRVVR